MATSQQLAKEWLDDRNTVILDTETTGLNDDAQVVELSIIDMQGNILLDTLIKPTVPIHPEAQAVHGITDAHLVNAPSAGDLADTLANLLRGKRIVTYNSDFDSRLLRQSLLAHRRGLPKGVTFDCAMRAYASWYQPRGARWQKLEAAAFQTGTRIQGTAHRALTDCHTTLGVIRTMASAPNHADMPGRPGRAFEINEPPKTPPRPKRFLPPWVVLTGLCLIMVLMVLGMFL